MSETILLQSKPKYFTVTKNPVTTTTRTTTTSIYPTTTTSIYSTTTTSTTPTSTTTTSIYSTTSTSIYPTTTTIISPTTTTIISPTTTTSIKPTSTTTATTTNPKSSRNNLQAKPNLNTTTTTSPQSRCLAEPFPLKAPYEKRYFFRKRSKTCEEYFADKASTILSFLKPTLTIFCSICATPGGGHFPACQSARKNVTMVSPRK